MRYFKKLSIKSQVLIIGIIIIAIIPFTFVKVYNMASEIIINHSTQNNEELISIMKQRVASNYDNISKLMTNLSYDVTVQNFLAEKDSLKVYELSEKVESLLGIIKNTNKDIIDIIIVSNQNKYVSLQGNLKDAFAASNELGSDGIVHYAGFRKAGQTGDRDRLLFGMNIFSTGDQLPYGDMSGYICIVLDVQTIKAEIEKYPQLALAGTTFYLFDSKQLVYTNSRPDDKIFNQMSTPPPMDVQNRSVIKNLMGDRYAVQAHVLQEISGSIVAATPLNFLMKDLNKLRTASYTLFFIAVLLVSVPYYILMMNLLKPLSKLMAFMKRLKRENLNALNSKVNLEGYAEIEVISTEFNTMLERIHELTDRLVQTSTQLYQSEIEKQRMEFAFLRSQINPHFLFNTLDSLKGLALAKGNKDIYEMAAALSRMLRYSIKGGDEVSLEEELKVVSSYVKIHQLRFFGRIGYELYCPEHLLPIRVPKMILQPIVENAISHGLEPLPEGGVVRISVQKNDEAMLEIIISDNGYGMEPARLAYLTELINAKQTTSTEHIGVTNVNNRIKYSYGDAYGITLHSTSGKGTEVRMILPS
ncbi:sensor histidine kinase [Paenibacillus alba]|uniref:sensor histidine kinase n=1 Tax=Paenibacillus alba TaxID=1197127 RepID=UPI0015635A5F|nr:sensor histidine kinase [Paenibacillus alba]NQX67184.1 sensor histidine kinase [Paenibacillus alba]